MTIAITGNSSSGGNISATASVIGAALGRIGIAFCRTKFNATITSSESGWSVLSSIGVGDAETGCKHYMFYRELTGSETTFSATVDTGYVIVETFCVAGGMLYTTSNTGGVGSTTLPQGAAATIPADGIAICSIAGNNFGSAGGAAYLNYGTWTGTAFQSETADGAGGRTWSFVGTAPSTPGTYLDQGYLSLSASTQFYASLTAGFAVPVSNCEFIKTLADLTLTSEADVLNRGSLTVTLDPVTLVATASAPVHAELTTTLDPVTLVATIVTSPVGFVDVTLDPLTLSSTGVVLIKGELTRTLADLTLVATAGTRIIGEAAITLDDVYTAPTISGAYAIATHTVRVILSAAPRHVSPYDAGDALNPLTWTVINPVTGFSYTIVGAAMHDDVTVDLSLLEALGSHLYTFIVGATSLAGASGGLSVNLSAHFVGTVQTIDPIQAVALDRFLDRDLANPPLQTELGGFGGTIQIGADGDYDTEVGVPLVKKLVIRRLSTPRGAFPHLPRYGVGILEKEPIVSSGNLVALKGEIENQINEEPDVEACRVGLLLDRSNVLQIQLRVKLVGSGATFDMQMHTANGQLVEIF